ncbi:hypothetical protein RQ831_15145 [Roseomonas gilardii]|uniref:Heme exporter protein D n=1 Tax=Roseomonas gilardii TaxID=257708 RepID=A0ABU3MHV2_9PROT|nr:hypothetical protein [Roseomonas gilardii]MDT8332397.1 hypothetical protein [Roseomonas gilardii]
MSLHWWHVTLAWLAAAIVLGGLSLGALWRQGQARRRLAALDGARGGQP